MVWFRYEVWTKGHMWDKAKNFRVKRLGYESFNLISASIHLNGLTGWYLQPGKMWWQKVGHWRHAFGVCILSLESTALSAFWCHVLRCFPPPQTSTWSAASLPAQSYEDGLPWLKPLNLPAKYTFLPYGLHMRCLQKVYLCGYAKSFRGEMILLWEP